MRQRGRRGPERSRRWATTMTRRSMGMPRSPPTATRSRYSGANRRPQTIGAGLHEGSADDPREEWRVHAAEEPALIDELVGEGLASASEREVLAWLRALWGATAIWWVNAGAELSSLDGRLERSRPLYWLRETRRCQSSRRSRRSTSARSTWRRSLPRGGRAQPQHQRLRQDGVAGGCSLGLVEAAIRAKTSPARRSGPSRSECGCSTLRAPASSRS